MYLLQRISRTALMNLRKNTETLSSTVMFHLIPAEINVDKLQSDQAIETLYPPHNLHASVYAMKMKISSSNARKRYIKKSATSLQCARIIDQADQKPCNGKILVVDEVSDNSFFYLVVDFVYKYAILNFYV